MGKYTVLIAGSEVDLWESIDFDSSLDLTVNKAVVTFPDSSDLLAAEGIGQDIQILRDGVAIWRGIGIKNQKIYDARGKKQYNLECLSNKVYLQNEIFSHAGNYVVEYGGSNSATVLYTAPAMSLAASLGGVGSSSIFNDIMATAPNLSLGIIGTTNIPHACLVIARQTSMQVLSQLIAGTLWEARFNADNTVDFGSNSNGTVGSPTSVFTFQEGQNIQKIEVDDGIDKLVNHVVVCGKGSASGYQVSYEASNSSSITTYGTFTKIVNLPNCADTNLLQAYAQALLTDLSSTVTTATIQLADLSTGVPFRMGDYVTVNNSSFNLNGALFRVISEHRHLDSQQGEVVDVVLAQNYRMVDINHFKTKRLEAVLNTQLQAQQIFNNTYQANATANNHFFQAKNTSVPGTTSSAAAAVYMNNAVSGISQGAQVSVYGAANNGAPQTGPVTLGYLVVLYIPPGSTWDTLISDHNTYPNVPVTAIINPSNGPGTSSNSSYVTYVAKLQAAGIKVIGYVATGGGGVSTATVEGQINDYQTWYAVDGIFMDEMSEQAAEFSYYQTLTNYIHSHGMALSVGNPGAPVYWTTLGAADVIICYENSGMPSTTAISSITTGSFGGASNWGFIAHDVASLPNQSTLEAFAPYVAWVYVTDGPGGNEAGAYQELPTYESTELSELSTGISATSASVGYVNYMDIYPGTAWTDLITAKQNNSVVPVILVADPNTTLPSAADSTYATWIAKAQAAGIKVLIMVWTNYGVKNGTLTLAQAETWVDNVYSWYKPDGIMIRQMDNTLVTANETYYSSLFGYIHSYHPGALVFADPEGITNSTYAALGQDVTMSDFTGLPTAATVDTDTITILPGPSKWGIRCISSTIASSSYIASVNTYITWICNTSQSDFSTESTFQATQVADLVVTNATSYVSRVYIYDLTSSTYLADSGTGNFGVSKLVFNNSVTADIFDHLIVYYCSVVGNGTNAAIASIINPIMSLIATIPS